MEQPIHFHASRRAPGPAEWSTHHARVRHLTVILKVTERCNLACPYCYYFFKGDESWRERPAAMSEDIILGVVRSLRTYAKDCAPERMRVVFHGGEPTLLKPARFDLFCDELRAQLAGLTKLELSIQTNGVHMPQEWIALLARHKVDIGLSFDGPPQYQDVERPTVDGRGSSSQILETVRALHAATEAREIDGFGSITVLNADYDVDSVVDYLEQVCGIHHANFLLPKGNGANGELSPDLSARFGAQLQQLFDRSLVSPGILVHEIAPLLSALQRRPSLPAGGDRFDSEGATVVYQSDGTMNLDDSFIASGDWRKDFAPLQIARYSLQQFLAHPCNREIRRAFAEIPAACADCRWKNICRGGRPQDRSLSAEGIHGRSAYCGSLASLYEHVAATLLAAGYPALELERALQANLISGRTVEPRNAEA